MSPESPRPLTSPRLLHAMLRVSDLQRSLDFYERHFGLREQRRIAFPEIPRTLVFLGANGDDGAGMQLELWHEPIGPVEAVSHNGHLGIGVHQIDEFVATLAAQGVPVRQSPRALRPGGRRLAIITDPDGHELELLALD
ncbi:MAG: lactoylglutathione lyase [Sinobacteraceae bacterium]|nr:lactoylglutathione lyase [Nevskiaceae bacterium]